MNTIEVPLVKDRPEFLSHLEPGDEFHIIIAVHYYVNLLIAYAPAELNADYSPDGKEIIWSVVSLPEKKELYTETMLPGFYRQCLGRIGASYMEGALLGGFSVVKLLSMGRRYHAAFFLGNGGICGCWFKARCVEEENNSLQEHEK